MKINTLNAVIIDDAFGPPPQGAVKNDDKYAWIDFVLADSQAQADLQAEFSDLGLPDKVELLEKLISEHPLISRLWELHEKDTLKNANLGIFFKSYELERKAKTEKVRIIRDVINGFIEPQQAKIFWRIDRESINALIDADVAFIDFHLDDNERPETAINRIVENKEHLKKTKIVFVMSYRATLEAQQQVRDIIGTKNAFFEVLRKPDINANTISSLLKKKCLPYRGNKALEQTVNSLVSATHEAAKEFGAQCEALELHDLNLLNLSRLSAEGESIGSYLSWLASESIAAKIRRISNISNKLSASDTENISFPGQLMQKKILFDLFSEVVFGPSHDENSPLHFGEIVAPKIYSEPRKLNPSKASLNKKRDTLSTRTLDRKYSCSLRRKTLNGLPHKKAKDRIDQTTLSHEHRNLISPLKDCFLLILTPACDLVRCPPSKTVLCVEGTAEDFSDIKMQSQDRLYGKHKAGLRHLMKVDAESSPKLITWHKDRTLTLTVKELLSGNFCRIAQMNEIYAQEVKEEVLRELGRVGTQIDPPPLFGLHANMKWKNDKVPHAADTGTELFYSSILTYSELRNSKGNIEKYPAIILSDEFKGWVKREIIKSTHESKLHKKLSNCLDEVLESKHLQLKSGFAYRSDGLLIRVGNDPTYKVPQDIVLEICLTIDERNTSFNNR